MDLKQVAIWLREYSKILYTRSKYIEHEYREEAYKKIADISESVAQVEAMACDIEAIEDCVARISGLSYHQGAFASISHKHPSSFEDYNKRKRDEWKKLRELLKKPQDGRKEE